MATGRAPLEKPIVLGRYRLVERLGAGGMAVVYRAVVDGPEGFSRSVVIKRVRPELCDDAGFVRSFVNEARVSALLHHPNIVQVYDFGKVAGEYFLAMEYIDGVDLGQVCRKLIEHGRVPPVGAMCHILAEVASALAYAHALRDESDRHLEIVHRDVSPSNIMITRRGAVKLLDFGIAKAAQHVRDEDTRTGSIKGKLSYLSPQQAEGLPIDHRADIYALGVTAHETFTVQRLFRGADDFETLRLVRQAKVDPPSRKRPDLSPEIDACVLRMLAFDPDQRFQNADELLRALRDLTHQNEGDAETVAQLVNELGCFVAGARASQESATRSTLGGSSGEMRSWFRGQRRRKTIGGAVAGAALLAAVLAGVLMARRHPPPAPTAAGSHVVASPPPAPSPTGASGAPTPSAAPPSAAPPSAAAPSAAAQARTVRARILGPRGAAVLVDGRAMGKAPLDLTLPRIDGNRTFVVRAGAASFTKTVSGAHDVSIASPSSTHTSKSPRHGAHDLPASELEDPFAN